MLQYQKRKKNSTDSVPLPRKKDALYDLVGVSGAGFAHRDPVYHLSQAFASSFSLAGGASSERGEDQQADPLYALRPPQEETPQQDQNQAEEALRAAPFRMLEYEGARYNGNGAFLYRFGKVAFERGDMAAGILRGQGRMMMISSLKRAAGQSPPSNDKQKKLYAGASLHRNMQGKDGKIIYNRYDVNTAVGMVVNSIRSGRRMLDQCAAAAREDIGREGIATLHKMYPFLSDAADKQLLAQYDAEIKRLHIAGGRVDDLRALEMGRAKVGAIIAKKRQQRIQFMTKLQELSDRAQEAERVFSSPGFVEDMMRELDDFAADDGQDDDGDGGDSGNDSHGDDA